MHFNTYSVIGALIAADLVNNPTADGLFLTDLFNGYQVHQATVTADAAEELTAWGKRLRLVFGATPVEQAERADALLLASGCRPRLVSHDELPYHLHYAPIDASLAVRVKALTAAGLAYSIADGAGDRLGCCQRSGCLIVFVDTSRNGRRRFCSIRCANAVNVSLHRARLRHNASRQDTPTKLGV